MNTNMNEVREAGLQSVPTAATDVVTAGSAGMSMPPYLRY